MIGIGTRDLTASTHTKTRGSSVVSAQITNITRNANSVLIRRKCASQFHAARVRRSARSYRRRAMESRTTEMEQRRRRGAVGTSIATSSVERDCEDVCRSHRVCVSVSASHSLQAEYQAFCLTHSSSRISALAVGPTQSMAICRFVLSRTSTRHPPQMMAKIVS